MSAASSAGLSAALREVYWAGQWAGQWVDVKDDLMAGRKAVPMDALLAAKKAAWMAV